MILINKLKLAHIYFHLLLVKENYDIDESNNDDNNNREKNSLIYYLI